MDPVEEIKSRLQIEEVVGQYVDLKKSGVNFKGLSPFVSEKTPSFVVSPDKQIAYCFATQKGGDIFKFIMEIEGIGFREALELLASKAGVALPEKQFDKGKRDAKSKAFEANALAAEFFQNTLWETPLGYNGRAYLEARHVDAPLAQAFSLGVAPDDWDLMFKALKNKGVGEKEMLDAGLIAKREKGSGFYDKFRNRLIFPITNSAGFIVGFAGRGMSDDAVPKYLNTAETIVYHKSHLLYNFDQAKRDIRREDIAIVVEGYMDVIASWKTSVRHVVASSGTALTVDHLKLIRRLTSRIAFAFDADRAGVDAALRAIELALKEDMEVFVIQIPNGKDADDCILEDPALWEEACAKPLPYLDFIIIQAFTQFDETSAEGRRGLTSMVLSHIVRLPSHIQQDFYIQKLANKLGVSDAVLREELRTASAVASKSSSRSRSATPEPSVPLSSTYSKEDYLYGILLHKPDLFIPFDEIVSADYSSFSEETQTRLHDLKMAWEKGELVGRSYDENTGPLVIHIAEVYGGYGSDQFVDELSHLASGLGVSAHKDELALKISALKRAEQKGDRDEIVRLKSELVALLSHK